MKRTLIQAARPPGRARAGAPPTAPDRFPRRTKLRLRALTQPGRR
jgi:hypothetical protein